MKEKIIILGNYLVVSAEEVKKDWGLLVEGNQIKDIQPNDALRKMYPDAAVFHGEEKIIAPGFVNGHHHMYGALSHGITVKNPPTDFGSFLDDFWWPCVENKITQALAVTSCKMAAVEMIKSGVTAFCDTLEAPYSLPNVLVRIGDAMEEIGLRGILSIEACQRVSDANGTLALKENESFVQLSRKKKGLISGMMSIHTTCTCSPDFIQKAADLSRKHNCLMHMHLCESVYEPSLCRDKYGMGPVHLYEKLGCLGENVLASQGVQLSLEEIKILADYGCKMVHMPLSNCEVGGGIAPVPEMLEAGLPVGLGSDGYINDFFEVMRGAFLLHKAAKQDPGIMPAKTVFRMATDLGAQVLGYNTGKIKAGAPADVIAIHGDLPTPVTEQNIFDQLVLFRRGNDVSDVMVNGKFLMKNRKLLTIDEEKTFHEGREAALKLWGWE